MDGTRLKIARENAHKTQSDIANLLNVTQNSVWRWEKNMVEPDDKKKRELAKILGVSLAYLMGESEPAEQAPALPDNSDRFVWVPVVEIEACAGNGHEYPEFSTNIVAMRPIPKTDLLGHSWQNDGYQIYTISGDSMEPRFSDNDDILISINEPVATGNIIIAWYQGKIYIRGYIERGDRIILKPLNAKYSQIEIEKGDADLYILGKVIARVPKIERVDSIF